MHSCQIGCMSLLYFERIWCMMCNYHITYLKSITLKDSSSASDIAWRLRSRRRLWCFSPFKFVSYSRRCIYSGKVRIVDKFFNKSFFNVRELTVRNKWFILGKFIETYSLKCWCSNCIKYQKKFDVVPHVFNFLNINY